MAGFVIATNCTDIAVTRLEEIYSRLKLYDIISKARTSVLNIYPNLIRTDLVHFCAWMNDRLLGNCMEPQVYNSELRDALNNVCGGKGRCRQHLCVLNSQS